MSKSCSEKIFNLRGGWLGHRWIFLEFSYRLLSTAFVFVLLSTIRWGVPSLPWLRFTTGWRVKVLCRFEGIPKNSFRIPRMADRPQAVDLIQDCTNSINQHLTDGRNHLRAFSRQHRDDVKAQEGISSFFFQTDFLLKLKLRCSNNKERDSSR